MTDLIEKINKNLETIALEVVTLDGEDIPALGNILNSLCTLEEDSCKIEQPAFFDLILALKGYLEKVILRETEDLEPLEEGVDCLQSICRCLNNDVIFDEDTSHILDKLGFKKSNSEKNEKKAGCKQVEAKDEGEMDAVSPVEELTEDDREIIGDFVMEALEGLGAIEVSLMDLEQDPDNLEIINSIFRPFHTIKGVSGFINLEKINKLAHSAENLLDKARNKEINIDGTIIDIILESTDMLKKMIEGVQEGLEKEVSLDNGLNVTPLINRIDEIVLQADQIGDKPLGEILVQRGAITTNDLERGLERQIKKPDKKFGRQHIDLQVKVDTKKLDNLVDLTGELVIAQSMLRQNQWILSGKDQKLLQTMGQLSQITSGLQTTAMSMRMVPIKSTFQKMVRLVRDLAKKSGKEVRLEMSGEDTEIDRNVVEELYEPMVHMIRNAVDHGIELSEERKKAGKSRRGLIQLRAYHQGGSIIVEVQDDGRGLDKERIIEKVRSCNLISDESKLTESEIYNLIFLPGFSTAKKVTDVSGRGVGMDVVKKGIEKLRGYVKINSRPGLGSTFIISLPLTLAIIEGMLVRVGQERYVLPALAILESFRLDKNQYSTVVGKGEIIRSRGNLIPLIRLDRIFNIKGDSIDPWDGLVVAVEHKNEQICLLLDELLGKEEVVIKNLGESLKDVKGIAGGAIMSDGRVGLILDMAGIFEIARE